MLRSIAQILLLLFAVLATTPGASELVENVVERLQHGHPAHSVPGEEDPFCADEGSAPCKGPSCECHVGAGIFLVELGAESGIRVEWTSLAMAGALRPKASGEPRVRWSDVCPNARSNAPPTPPPNPLA